MLRQFDTLYSEVGIYNSENFTSIILGLDAYFRPLSVLSKQNLVVHSGIRKPHGLKVRLHTDRLIDINKKWKFCMMELNEIMLNSMPNSCSNQPYVLEFYSEYISFKSALNMF